MIDTELAYLAGIFDGEGSVYIGQRAMRSQGVKTGKTQYVMGAALGMTDPYIPMLLHEEFGGSLLVKRRSEKNSAWQDVHLWGIDGRAALAFLEVIQPWVRIKKLQVDLAVRFQQRRKTGVHLTESQRAVQEAERITMGELNHPKSVRPPISYKKEI